MDVLIRDAADQLLRKEDYELLSWICSHPATPEDLLLDFCDRGICLDDLGHRTGPRKLLERMAAVHRYPEAIVTLATELFTNAGESARAFETFANEHADCDWMLESLARRPASSLEKEALFETIVRGRPGAARILRIREVYRWKSTARQTTDPKEIQRLYETGEPDVLRALAGNQATPRSLLESLAAVKNVKNAADIRNRARRRLDDR